MNNAPQIVWKGLESSESLSQRITQLAHAEPIETCRVVVEIPHRHHHQGPKYQVKVEATCDGHPFAATSDGFDDAYAAVNDAFAGLTRQLDAQGPKRRAVLRHARHA